MAMQTTRVDASEFERFATLPENADRLLELIGGEIVEVVSNGVSSALGSRLNILIGGFVLQKRLGFTTGADGGYAIGSERYIPDCAFVSKAKQTVPSSAAYNSIPPDLAVEVLSPSNTPDEMAIKVDNYLRAGVIVWVVNPDPQRVTVHQPDAAPKTYGIDGTLDGGTVLPGFTLPVSDIFANKHHIHPNARRFRAARSRTAAICSSLTGCSNERKPDNRKPCRSAIASISCACRMLMSLPIV